ncbi:MAG: hypothetical protein HY895_09320 [Deltaproteobacteria bacterium]|nr:hypothetical protein [Deltaproteobacteria bacterium]
MPEKLWKGRNSERTAQIVESFTASIDDDKRLYRTIEKGRELHDLPLTEMQSFSARIQDDIYDHLRTHAVVKCRVGQGATGESAVQGAIAAAEKRLA